MKAAEKGGSNASNQAHPHPSASLHLCENTTTSEISPAINANPPSDLQTHI